MWLWSWQVSGSLTAFTCERRASVGLEHEWEQAASPARGSCHAACGFDDKEQVHGCKFVGLTKTKAAKQQKEGGWHIFHSLHGCQQWWFIRGGEKKKKSRAEEVTYMARKSEWERASGRQCSASCGFYFWFICVPLSGFLPPTLAGDSRWMRAMYLTAEVLSPIALTWRSEPSWASGLFPSCVSFSMVLSLYLHR